MKVDWDLVGRGQVDGDKQGLKEECDGVLCLCVKLSKNKLIKEPCLLCHAQTNQETWFTFV